MLALGSSQETTAVWNRQLSHPSDAEPSEEISRAPMQPAPRSESYSCLQLSSTQSLPLGQQQIPCYSRRQSVRIHQPRRHQRSHDKPMDEDDNRQAAPRSNASVVRLNAIENWRLKEMG
ncbi:hypothetical protein PCANC_00368 [Puccinia coronata f. sp. avenae]|uniref:Uncharacterized protein n=1 Tax=Puccinia coronata f. sp. avenae TaxID=200324 RepID=A0A2N5W933_9BASI|nr:hypothetical protein PCANC_00368 [Puccinia coronata f. sp. avenae]